MSQRFVQGLIASLVMPVLLVACSNETPSPAESADTATETANTSVEGAAVVAHNKARVIEAVTATLKNAQLVDQYYDENFITHNGYNPHGQDGMRELLGAFNADGAPDIEVARAIADSERVALHLVFDIPSLGKFVTFDLYRLENNKIAEHWDSVALRVPPNASGREQFDGETAITDLDKTEDNRARAVAFINEVVSGQTPDYGEYFVEDVIQHSTGMSDGLTSIQTQYLSQPAMILDPEAITSGTSEGEESSAPIEAVVYKKLHFTVAEGNFVLTVAEGYIGEAHQAFYDLFRFDQGKVVEHWRSIDTIFGDEAPNNQYGKF